MSYFLQHFILIGTAFAQGGTSGFTTQGGGTSGFTCPAGGTSGFNFPGIGCLPNPLGSTSITDILTAVWTYLFYISIPIVAIMVIIGAFQLMFAGGNEEKVSTAKKTILYAVIGFAIVLLAGSVVPILNQLFSSGSSASPAPPSFYKTPNPFDYGNP